jgi:ubiquinone/menaquinone biosynthesis C-methylase UbiE
VIPVLPPYIRFLQKDAILYSLHIRKTDTILDVGCGTGYFASALASAGAQPIAVDVTHADFRAHSVQFIQARGQQLPFSTCSCDKILASSVLQMVDDPEVVLAEMHRVLKKNGIAVITVPIDRVVIPKLFHKKSMGGRVFLWYCGLFGQKLSSYHAYKKQWFRGKRIGKKDFYSLPELTSLINDGGFSISMVEYAPRGLSNTIYEITSSLAKLTHQRFWNRISFVFLPLCPVDNRSAHGYGCEVILQLRKNSSHPK